MTSDEERRHFFGFPFPTPDGLLGLFGDDGLLGLFGPVDDDDVEVYRAYCLQCDAALSAHVGPADEPPWSCENCATTYWCAQITDRVRGGDDVHRPTLETEQLHALWRGCSLRPEQLDRVDKDALFALLEREGLDEGFRAAAAAEFGRRS